MLEHDSQYAVILAFDVKIERDAQDLADNLGVKIFQVCGKFLYYFLDNNEEVRRTLYKFVVLHRRTLFTIYSTNLLLTGMSLRPRNEKSSNTLQCSLAS